MSWSLGLQVTGDGKRVVAHAGVAPVRLMALPVDLVAYEPKRRTTGCCTYPPSSPDLPDAGPYASPSADPSPP